MRIDAAQLSAGGSYRSVKANPEHPTCAGADSGSASDSVELSGSARSYATDGRQDLESLDPVERLAAMAMEALVGHQIRWLSFRPPVAVGATGVSVPVRVQTSGSVTSRDGRAVEFRATLEGQRPGEAGDGNALAVSVGGRSLVLTGATISFGFGVDGAAAEVSFVGAGNGVLAVDKSGVGL